MTAHCLSVLVPTYNRHASLTRLLDALSAQSYRTDDVEVVVVDDGSTDGTGEMLGKRADPYHLRVTRQANGGPAIARNRAAAQATGEVILFLDDDVVPESDLLACHVKAHRDHSNAVVIGPMLPPDEWPRPPWIRWEEDKLLSQYRDLAAGKYACTPRQFYTANASLPRALFQRAGGFDPHFMRAEDVELAFRLRDLGTSFVFAPDARVRHFPTRSFQAWARIPYQYGRYDVIMQRDKGHETLDCTTIEFHRRHPLARLLTRALVGRRLAVDLAVPALGAFAGLAAHLRSPRAGGFALSAAFALQYWQGACDELGTAPRLWSAIAAARSRT